LPRSTCLQRDTKVANSEHLKILKLGVEEWNRWRGENEVLPDLVEDNLTSANLSGAILRSAKLTGADLNEANLNRADLHGANLSGADLSMAVLYGRSCIT
jgi:uncharacterized protein YjbI with pentapeptide repeats